MMSEVITNRRITKEIISQRTQQFKGQYLEYIVHGTPSLGKQKVCNKKKNIFPISSEFV